MPLQRIRKKRTDKTIDPIKSGDIRYRRFYLFKNSVCFFFLPAIEKWKKTSVKRPVSIKDIRLIPIGRRKSRILPRLIALHSNLPYLFMQAKSFSKAIKSCASKAKLQCRNIKLTGRRSPVSFFIRYVLGLNRKNSFLPVRRQNPVPLFLVAEAIFPLKDSSMPGQESDLFYAPDCR